MSRVLLGGLSLVLLALSVKHCVVGWARSVLAIAWTILFYRFVWRLLMCLFVQHDSKCRHVSYSLSGHRTHSGKIYCFKGMSLTKLPV